MVTALTTRAPTSPAPGSPYDATRHIGGLDGLRGIAVAAVVVYHLWPGTLPAGFLGVTLFFALSGYLITTLLLDELDRTGRIALAAFWARRLRRLMPASWLVLAAVLVVWAGSGWLTGSIRRDVLWSAVHVANWGRIADAQAYGVSPEASPVLHFWSLSIEEQCYLVLPVLVAVAARYRRVGMALAACFMASVAAVGLAWDDPVRSYFSTFTRGGELIAGALAAVVVRRRARSRHRSADAVALAGLALLAVAAVATSLGSTAYSRGGLLLAGIVAAISVAAVGASTRLGAVLDVRPLAWLGSVSYAVYLFHWPLLVGMRSAGIGPSLAPWLTLAATLLLAQLSGRFVERPIRARRRVTRYPGPVAAGALGVLVLAAVAIPATSTAAVFDADRAAQLAEQRRADIGMPPATATATAAPSTSTDAERTGPTTPAVPPPPAAPTTTARTGPTRYAWVSDSTGLPLVLGIRSPDGFEVAGWWTEMGCPVGRGGRVRSASTGTAVWTTSEKGCEWDRSLATTLPSGGIDVALVSFGRWDIAEREVPALDNRWTSIDDPAYAQWLLSEMRSLTEQLHRTGVSTVVWLTLLHDDAHTPRGRVDRFNELVRSIGADPTSGRVEVLDLAGWLEATGELDRLLPDGVHATFEPDGGTADEIGRRFLFPELERLLDR